MIATQAYESDTYYAMICPKCKQQVCTIFGALLPRPSNDETYHVTCKCGHAGYVDQSWIGPVSDWKPD